MIHDYVYEEMKDEQEELKAERGREMVNAREAVKDVRLELKEIKERVGDYCGDGDLFC